MTETPYLEKERGFVFCDEFFIFSYLSLFQTVSAKFDGENPQTTD
jgi:hypothetical protein